jgi:hypothetical protein
MTRSRNTMYVVGAVLLVALSSACKLTPDLSGFCFTFSGEGCPSHGGGITYVYDRVTINPGGVIDPASLTTTATPSSEQLPAIHWVNQDSLVHRVVSDSRLFDTGNMGAYMGVAVPLSQRGTFPYHCAIHPTMVGSIVVR